MNHEHLKLYKGVVIKRTTTIILVFTLLLTGLVYGQQDPHYTQYMYNQNILNPAYAGSRGDLSIGLLGRTQWVGIDGAPDTQTLNIHSAVGNHVGVGLSAIHDQIGPLEESNVSLDFSYTIPMSESANLAFGVKGTYTFIEMGKVNPLYEDNAFLGERKDNYGDIGAGAYYYTDKFYLGLSVPNILEDYSYSIEDLVIQDISDEMHFFGTLGYVFDLNNNLKFKPSAMLKFVQGSPISVDLNGSLFINELFEIGLSWREGDSVDALLGVQASPSVRIGYAYDYTLTNLSDYNSGSHELMLLFDLDFSKKNIKSPRFF